MVSGSADREEMREPNATYDGFTTKNRFTTETQRLTEAGHGEKPDGINIHDPYALGDGFLPLCVCSL